MLHVLIADKNTLATSGIAAVTESAFPGCNVSCVATASDAMLAAGADRFDAAILALLYDSSPDGLTATKRILAKSPDTRVMLMHDDWRPYVVTEACIQGASCIFDSKTDTHIQLKHAITALCSGSEYFSQRVISMLAATLRDIRPTVLTEDEERVLLGLRRRKNAKEIADELKVHKSTISRVHASLLTKLRLPDGANDSDIIHAGARLGLTQIAAWRHEVSSENGPA